MKELIQFINRKGETESVTIGAPHSLRMNCYGLDSMREYSCTKIELVKLYVFREEKSKKKKKCE